MAQRGARPAFGCSQPNEGLSPHPNGCSPSQLIAAMVSLAMRSPSTTILFGSDSREAQEIAAFLEREWAMAVRRARRWAELPPGSSCDLVVLELPVLGSEAVTLARSAARLRPAPIQLAFGEGLSGAEAFALARAGVQAYLSPPVRLARFDQALREALQDSPNLPLFAQRLVGRRGLPDVQREVRRLMIEEAFARTGSRSGAARLLQVTRQAVQQALREAPPEESGSEVPAARAAS